MRRFILFRAKRHLAIKSACELPALLTHLAVERPVAAARDIVLLLARIGDEPPVVGARHRSEKPGGTSTQPSPARPAQCPTNAGTIEATSSTAIVQLNATRRLGEVR